MKISNFSTYSSWLKYWIENRTELKKTTRDCYNIVIESYLIPEFGKKRVEDLKEKTLQNYLEEISSLRQLSKSWLNIVTIVLRNSINDYYKYNSLESFVPISLSIPKGAIQTPPEKDVYSEEEEEKIISLASKSNKTVYIGILMAIMCGMRIGEVCAAKWCDFDTENNIFKVRRTAARILKDEIGKNKVKTQLNVSAPKSQKSTRNIPLPEDLAAILKEKKKDVVDDNTYILSGNDKPYNPGTLRFSWIKFCEENDIPKKNFHTLRHTFATHWLMKGFDVKVLSIILGHSTPSFTMEVYNHPTVNNIKSMMKNYSDSRKKDDKST